MNHLIKEIPLVLFTADVTTSAYINTTKDEVVYATTVESITVNTLKKEIFYQTSQKRSGDLE
jgi:hypothetical protein